MTRRSVTINTAVPGVDGTGIFEQPVDGPVRLVELTLTAEDGAEITTAAIRSWPLTIAIGLAERAFANAAHEQPDEVWLLVRRPNGTDRWYRDFARVFQLAKTRYPAPAAAIAERSDVPVATVHRWTREARRRGHLPPDARSTRDH